MAVGRSLPPPEEARSWDEFVARVEAQHAAGRSGRFLWQATGALLFVTGLIWFAYAFQGGRPWMFGCGIACLAAVGVLAARAVSAAEREGHRSGQLDLMERAWEAQQRRLPPGQ
ncbi:MAG TPA: hypothetical protein VH478_04475 [Trebonia sp.]|jgi:hypothetical protein|nr:hypothetical protein [Trebonia sp.]